MHCHGNILVYTFVGFFVHYRASNDNSYVIEGRCKQSKQKYFNVPFLCPKVGFFVSLNYLSKKKCLNINFAQIRPFLMFSAKYTLQDLLFILVYCIAKSSSMFLKKILIFPQWSCELCKFWQCKSLQAKQTLLLTTLCLKITI